MSSVVGLPNPEAQAPPIALLTATASKKSSRRVSTRFSTYSAAPTLTPSIAPSRLSVAHSDPKNSIDFSAYKPSGAANVPRNRTSAIEPGRLPACNIAVDEAGMIKVAAHLRRLEDRRLQQQRFVVSEGKREEMGRLALGAKLDKALGRRLSGQDAVFTIKKKTNAEKS